MNNLKKIIIFSCVTYGLYFSYLMHKCMPNIIRLIYFH